MIGTLPERSSSRVVSEVFPETVEPAQARNTALRKRILSGLAVGGFGLLVVILGGWWFTAAVGGLVHLGLLEFFRMAQFKGIRPATKTTLVACQMLLFSTQWAVQGGLPDTISSAVLPLSGAAICAWLLLQPVTGSIADIAASIFGLFYLGFLPSHWLSLRNLTLEQLAPGTAGWCSSGLAITLSACLMIVASVLSDLAVVNACIAGHGGVDHVVARVVHGDAQVNTGRARIVRQDIGGGLS